MISRVTGEVAFLGGFRISAHGRVGPLCGALPPPAVSRAPLPVSGWHQLRLGDRETELGRFTVEVVSDPDDRVAGVFLSHVHPFYEAHPPGDAERRVFHEGVISSELSGQREHAWGQVLCRVAPEENRDWLVVIYSPFSAVAMRDRGSLQHLLAVRHSEHPGPA